MRLFDVAGVYAVLQFVRSKAALVGCFIHSSWVRGERSARAQINGGTISPHAATRSERGANSIVPILPIMRQQLAARIAHRGRSL
jgi:hypothetical protein